MSRGTVEIPVEVWEGCERDAERIAFLHKQNAALSAENERLKQPWVKILTESETWNALSEVARLTAENERLRKAGDAMAESINFDDQRTWEDWGNQGKSLLRDCVIDWIIAKRGDEK